MLIVNSPRTVPGIPSKYVKDPFRIMRHGIGEGDDGLEKRAAVEKKFSLG
jgi:hypothetical protein